jgi:NAD(P)-dependent dehydrogenase (short-subunit alcohol dehydrogenase family)
VTVSQDLIAEASVVVSAGASGAGRIIAETFADRGANVLVCDIDREAVTDLAAARPDIVVEAMDAADEKCVDSLFAKAEARGRPVDVVVNNVGIAGPTLPAESIGLDDWNQSLRANLTSHFLFARRAIPGMKDRARGLIVNISSGSAKTGLPLRLPYVVSKGAVLSLTAILPGAIRGERMQRVIDNKAAALGLRADEYERTLLRYVSLRTMVDPEDIAAMVLFLASAQGARISGQMIGVDGNIEYEE